MSRWPAFFPHQESSSPDTAWNQAVPCDVMVLFLWEMGMGNTDQGRRLGWNALKDYCFLTGSLLLEQREKFGHNFMSSRTAFAVWIHEADLAPRADGRGLHLTQGFGVNTPGGSRVPSLSPFFVEEGGEKSIVFAADYLFWSVPSLFCLETEWIYLVST